MKTQIKILALAVILALGVDAQSLTITGPPTAQSGSSVTLSVVLAGTSVVTDAQWATTFPAGITIVPSIGTSASAASKTLTCSTAIKCIAYGLNRNVIAAGEVAKLLVTFPVVASGVKTFTLSGLKGANASAAAVALTAGAPYTITVTNQYDLSGDGLIDINDVKIGVDQATGTSACGSGDVNSDGVCDIIDVAIIVLRALGL